MRFFGVNRDESSESLRMFPVFDPLIELLYFLFFFFNLFAELFRFPCSPVSFSLTLFLFIFLPPEGNSGSHQSGYEIANEILEPLHFAVTPPRSLLVLSPQS